MIAVANKPVMTERWYPLRMPDSHRSFERALTSERIRFVMGCAGRRSGKTERVKRNGVKEAIAFHEYDNGRFVFGAPTQQQAKDIWWDDLKLLVPDWALLGTKRDSVYESSPQTILLYNGVRIIVAGLDKPKRIEGPPLDWIALDEYADMKAQVWEESILPAVSTTGRPGRVRFIGKPRGRNHYWRLMQSIKRDETGLWSYHHWTSHEILTEAEIEILSLNMDLLTFQQEILANFVNFEGRAYYTYDDELHVFPVRYDPKEDLVLCFDFNQSPGTATVLQEQGVTREMREHCATRGCTLGERVTVILDEVWIPKGSNSRMVAQALARNWKRHQGDVRLYGDATGGAKHSSSTDGSDWDLITEVLDPIYGDRVGEYFPRANPSMRARINSVNTRLRTAHDVVSMLVHPRCANTRIDFEGVTLLEGTGDIDKDDDKMLTHLSDGVGYYIEERWPIGGGSEVFQI